MAQAFINRSLRQFVPPLIITAMYSDVKPTYQFVPLRRQLPTNTHRVVRVLEENENLFVRRRRRERKAIRPKTTESDSSYGRIVSGRSPRNQTVCTKERSGEETKRRKDDRNESGNETKETKNENPYTLLSSAANLFTTGPTNRHAKPIRHVTKRPMEDEMIKRDGPDRGGG